MPATARPPTGERPDLATLFQRLADVLVRLFGERLSLAKAEARMEVERLLVVGASLAVGAFAVLVGALLLAEGAVEALRPLVSSHLLRLMLVAAPLVAFGTHRVRGSIQRARAAPPEDDRDPAVRIAE